MEKSRNISTRPFHSAGLSRWSFPKCASIWRRRACAKGHSQEEWLSSSRSTGTTEKEAGFIGTAAALSPLPLRERGRKKAPSILALVHHRALLDPGHHAA